uniref:Protein KASH5 n=1 Tax=Malurus cyaneus samueli TaxID=2593467 RepID=A0A8C5TVI6_9PASS
PAESSCSDEFALDCTFAACDPERTGSQTPWVVEYVAAMTGHSGHDRRLQALQQALDSAATGTALDWTQFCAAMRAWIAACRQDRPVPRDGAVAGAGRTGQDTLPSLAVFPRATREQLGLPSSAETAELRSRARQLAAQNTKLQRDAELAEELNAHLAEETAQLQAQLRRCSRGASRDRVWMSILGMFKTLFASSSSRQALEQARVAAEELEDVKAVVKRLEEENTELRRQARHTVRGSAQVPRAVMCGVVRCPLMAMPSPGEGAAQPMFTGRGSTGGGEPGTGSCLSRAVPQGTPAPFHPWQNQRLLAEGQGLREQIQAQAAQMASLEVSSGTVATLGGAGGCARWGQGVSPSLSLCPGPALPWHCPALCPGCSPCTGEYCPVTLLPPQLSPGPPPALSHSTSYSSHPGPVPTGRAAGTGADSSTGGV